VVDRVGPWFGIEAGSPADVSVLAAAEIDAKNPYLAFSADSLDKQLSASPELRAAAARSATAYEAILARRGPWGPPRSS
jgi:hypothetical protein